MSISTIIWIVVGLLLIIGVAAVVVVGLRYSRQNQEDDLDPVMARLADATQRGETVSLEDAELQQPFMERIVVPIIKRVGDISARFTPQKLLQETTQKLELAGNPGRIDAATFLATRFVVATLFGGGLLLIALFSDNSWSVGRIILIVTAFTVLGFFFPQLWLQGRINARQNEVRKAMPDALDLLTICVEAGLGFDAAMSKVAEKWENELSVMFGRCIREVQLGKPQREALRDMADRIGLPELTSFVAAVIQSQILGVSLSKVLHIQSDQMRVKRRQHAEELAHQAPVKMIIPMTFLTFPTIMIILMVPAGFQMAGAFGFNIGQ
ncbi:MAG: type II secretion system F family protein [Anaerolineales bacterium]|nr:type II secretion system F family protein [Anaerolineales bacterium]MBP6209728.1 type II secretion system F family protein [Anaerolineales bacterium]MBP8164826.1 type II secretion system F family protein [Anaerolineales bacterium]